MPSKDYIMNREAAKEMANRVQEYYRKQGQNNVRVWVEPQLLSSSSNRKMWVIRSNIIFNVATVAD